MRSDHILGYNQWWK